MTTKHELTFVLVILFILSPSMNHVSAQKIGIKGGLNLANVRGDAVEDKELKLGFTIGGFVMIDLSEQFFVRPEIFYSSKGFTNKITESESNADYELSYSGESSLSLNYLEIPVQLVFALTKSINFYTGPYLEIYLNGKATSESEGYYRYLMNDEWIYEDLTGSDSEDIEAKEINSPGYGLVFGGEYVLGQFSFDVRYSLGLSNIPEEDGFDLKHQVIQFMIGFYLQ